MNESSEEAGTKILTTGELVSGVVEKHRRFLEEYKKEFEELDGRLGQIEGEVKSARDSRNQMKERKEILREKRQQFYHQAEGLLEKELLPKLDPMPADKLQEDLKKLKGQAEPSEEQRLAGEFKENLREFAQGAGLEESIILQIEVKIDEALNPNLEIKKIEEDEKQLEEDDGSKSQEISKGKPQHKWLNSKIKSHEDALRYWEKMEG
ncbi:hypothetical protein FTO70_11585 [Methanosarcina sp. KYL-1]|nr:hypothetical protein [Methanosarcina sp. KYL-1]